MINAEWILLQKSLPDLSYKQCRKAILMLWLSKCQAVNLSQNDFKAGINLLTLQNQAREKMPVRVHPRMCLQYTQVFFLTLSLFPPIVRKNTDDLVSNKSDRIWVPQGNYVSLKWLSKTILLKLAWNGSKLPDEVRK